MTKRRAPLSIGQAVMRVADEIGFDGIERETGHKERTVRNMSDPDHVTEITLKDAIALDIAFSAAGGVGYPFHQCFSHKLSIEAAATASDIGALVEKAAMAVKENGDANAALFKAIAPGATAADLAIARREIEQAIAADQNTLAALDAQERPSRESG